MTTAALVVVCALAVWTYLLLMVLLTAVYRRWRKRRSVRRRFAAAHGEVSMPACLLVRPCSGDEEALLHCLTSVLRANRSGALKVLFGVESETDRAVPVIRRAMEILQASGLAADMVVAPVLGPNRKVSILQGCMGAAGAFDGVVISADSNTDLTGFDLDRFVKQLLVSPGSGAVWAPPRLSESPGRGTSPAEAVLHRSWHSFGLLSAIDPSGMVGKLFAIRSTALAKIGGFGALVRYLGEDMEMSRRLRRAGASVESVLETVRTVSGETDFGSAVARQTRWIHVIRAQRPALMISYPLLFFSGVFIAPIAVLCALFFPVAALSVLAGIGGVRLLVGYSAAAMLGIRSDLMRVIRHAFVADTLLLFAFLRALFSRSVSWRGRRYTLSSNGELREET